MEDLVSCNNGEVLLNSALSEEQFAKTHFVRFMDESGVLFDGEDFSTWHFSTPKTIGDIVYFSVDESTLCSVKQDSLKDNGDAFVGDSAVIKRSTFIPLNKIAGNKIMQSCDDNVKKALISVIGCYFSAIDRGVKLPCTGPAGVLLSGDFKRVVFLGEEALTRSAQNYGKEFFMSTIDPWLYDHNMTFTLAVYMYFTLTKQLPFPIGSSIDKSVSIATESFIPLHLMISGVDSTLSKFIDDALSIRSVARYDKSAIQDAFKEVLKGGVKDDDTLIAAREEFIKKQKVKLRRRKFSTKWAMALIAGAAAIIVISIFIIWGVYENGEKPTTLGLSDRDTTLMFYTGLCNMDADYMIAAAGDCLEAQPYISRTPQIFVGSIMRGALSMESGIAKPVEWLFYEPDTSKSYAHIIYGITNFIIDGNPCTLTMTAPTKMKHPIKVTRRLKERLGDFSSATHTVQYNLVHTVDNNIQIDKFKTTVTLRYKKDRWEILSLSESGESETLATVAFAKALKGAIKIIRAKSSVTLGSEASKKSGDIVSAVELLRNKYTWLPSQKEVLAEKARLDKLGY